MRRAAPDSHPRKPAVAACAVAADPLSAAHHAGLRYVSNNAPGIRRVRSGSGFRYVDPAGRNVRDPQQLERIKSLVIPPAWREVWICASEDGHLQAVGRDQRNRKQYRYHPRWRAVRDQAKYDQLVSFGRALPPLRARIEQDLGRPGLPREKVLAALVRLLDSTLIRIGNQEYARSNDTFGLTTLREQHVSISGASIRFQFRGKSGVEHAVDINDRRVARILQRMVDLPGEELFQYLDEGGERRIVQSADVNQYLRDITARDFTAKDFRTWAGTVLAARALQGFPLPASQTEAKRNVAAAIASVASALRNTRAVCRKCYVHPEIIAAYVKGKLAAPPADDAGDSAAGLRNDEAATLRLLEQRLDGRNRQ